MNRCPQCYQIYEAHEKYCEIDGEGLLSDLFLFVDTEGTVEEENDQRKLPYAGWTAGLIGALVGIIICLGCFAAYTFWILQLNPRDQETPSYVSGLRDPAPTTQRVSARLAEPAPPPIDSPSPEPEASAEPTAAPPAPPDVNNVAVTLNQGPVSTGSRSKEREGGIQTVIEMSDGSIMEVEAAWRDDQGVWYRRGGLVSFVESWRVKAITAKAEPKASPTSDH